MNSTSSNRPLPTMSLVGSDAGPTGSNSGSHRPQQLTSDRVVAEADVKGRARGQTAPAARHSTASTPRSPQQRSLPSDRRSLGDISSAIRPAKALAARTSQVPPAILTRSSEPVGSFNLISRQLSPFNASSQTPAILTTTPVPSLSPAPHPRSHSPHKIRPFSKVVGSSSSSAGVSQWEQDKHAGFSLEERVRREFERKVVAEAAHVQRSEGSSPVRETHMIFLANSKPLLIQHRKESSEEAPPIPHDGFSRSRTRPSDSYRMNELGESPEAGPSHTTTTLFPPSYRPQPHDRTSTSSLPEISGLSVSNSPRMKKDRKGKGNSPLLELDDQNVQPSSSVTTTASPNRYQRPLPPPPPPPLHHKPSPPLPTREHHRKTSDAGPLPAVPYPPDETIRADIPSHTSSLSYEPQVALSNSHASTSQPLDPPTPGSSNLEITDLDVLLGQLLEQSPSHELNYEALSAVTEFLGPASTDKPTASMEDGIVMINKRRVTKDGRVKIKLSLNGMDVERCSICLNQFKVLDKGTLLSCKHPFHAKCLSGWISRKRTCPTCRCNIE